METEVIGENDVLRPEILPGFELSMSEILEEADAAADAEAKSKREDDPS